MKTKFPFKKGDKVYFAYESGRVEKLTIAATSPSRNAVRFEYNKNYIHVSDFGRTACEALTKKFIRKTWSLRWKTDKLSKEMLNLKVLMKELSKLETKLQNELKK